MGHILTQQEADFFFQMEKFPEDEKEYSFPGQGEKLVVPFTSKDKHESFVFDIYRGSIKVSKITYQNRVRRAFVLRRFDLGGAPHLNPEVENVPLSLLAPYNGKEIEPPHLHLYIEGFGEKWAVPVEVFLNVSGSDGYEMMRDFFSYCNVKKMPIVTKTLFV